MNKKVLIVEDQFVEANDLQMMLAKAGYEVCGIARSVPVALELIKKEKPGIVLLDIFLKGKQSGIELARHLKEENIGFIYLSANSNEQILAQAKVTEPYGFIVKPFREKDLFVTLEIAQYLHEHSRETRYRREVALIQQLEKAMAGEGDGTQKLLQVVSLLQPAIPFDLCCLGFNSSVKLSTNAVCFLRIGFNEYQTLRLNDLVRVAGVSHEKVLSQCDAVDSVSSAGFYTNEAFEKQTQTNALHRLFSDTFDVNSLLLLPIQVNGGERDHICFYSRRADAYNSEHLTTIRHLHQTLQTIIAQANLVDKIDVINGTSKPGIKKVTGQDTSHQPGGFEGIIGNSHLLLRVFDHITQVAPFDTSVLILGESGTGKERIAGSIHHLSSRKGKALVKVNCAALPPTLIESELFGHERGAFTGAIDKKIGKFEQADGGTIFLDEIGEMPVDLQVKLLRVLQEMEIEPIGCKGSIKINVRVIAATNRNLEKEVAEGRFRLDLYYRLNVFPIVLPPLRDRPEDIPYLSSHFIKYYNQKSGKNIAGLSEKVLKEMMDYRWPGNIRELENLIERSVLLTKGNAIEEIALAPVQLNGAKSHPPRRLKTMHENEREYILTILRECNGRIWGSGGAAEILNLPPTTLKSKMKKLGIRKEDVE